MNTSNTIAFQGVPGAHSDMACRKVYPYMQTLPCPTFDDVFEAVARGQAALGFIPTENSQAGKVAEIHNLLPEYEMNIIGEYFHKVEHHLFGVKGSSLETIKTVYSHPQALMQCRKATRKYGLSVVPYSDTARAAMDLKEWNDVTKAAIASDLAGELYGLEKLASNIQDSDTNTTLFCVIAPEPIDPDPAQGTVITTLLFTTRHIPAGLFKALGGFATNGVNLYRLDSYIPDDQQGGTAQFFLSFEGHPREKRVQLALEELGFFTKKVKILGTYLADPHRFKPKK